jgi:comEA protein
MTLKAATPGKRSQERAVAAAAESRRFRRLPPCKPKRSQGRNYGMRAAMHVAKPTIDIQPANHVRASGSPVSAPQTDRGRPLAAGQHQGDTIMHCQQHGNTTTSWESRLVRTLLAAVLCVCWGNTARAEPNSAADASHSAAQPPGVVNINAASAEELERLPGIGPSRARAILALRAQLKHFTRLEELLRVKGIGRATFRKLRPLLSLQGETTLTQ